MLIRVLLVEDSKAQRLYIKSFLPGIEGLQFEVIEAHDGAQGLARAAEARPDAVLCDINMPVMDGFEFVSRLRQTADLATVPVIMITTQSDRDSMRRAMGSGADDVLTKPFTSNELIEAITSQLTKKRRQAEQTRASLDNLRASVLNSLPHELQTPLTAIVGGAELLLRRGDKLKPEKQREMLELIHRGGLRLTRTIGRYLELVEIKSRTARPGTDLAPLDKAWLETVLRDPVARSILGGFISQDGHDEGEDYLQHIELDIAPAVLRLHQQDLIRILYELVGNALRFRREGTVVRIVGREEGGGYGLQIENHGQEMPPGFSMLLGEFMQFSRDVQEQQGMGFGLSIAMTLLAQNHGLLQWTGTRGAPNTVKLRLPRISAAEYAAA